MGKLNKFVKLFFHFPSSPIWLLGGFFLLLHLEYRYTAQLERKITPVTGLQKALSA